MHRFHHIASQIPRKYSSQCLVQVPGFFRDETLNFSGIRWVIALSKCLRDKVGGFKADSKTIYAFMKAAGKKGIPAGQLADAENRKHASPPLDFDIDARISEEALIELK
jgi:hypothetical protein